MKSNKNTNYEIVKEAIKKLKETFISGVSLSDLDFSEIKNVEQRILSIANSRERQDAWSKISKQLDEFNEFILMHTDNNGFYIKTDMGINKKFAIKSKQQYERDYFDSNRKTNTYLFAELTNLDENGNEYYTFNEAGYFGNNPILDMEFQIMFKQFYGVLNNKEHGLLDLKKWGYSLQDCSQISGLTYKQARGIIDKIKQKYTMFFGDYQQI